MKRQLLHIVLILFIILIQNIYCQINQQWKWVHPLPQGNTLNWVKVFSATDWVAIGNLGTFMRTTNAGVTWDIYTNAGGTSPTTRHGNSLSAGWFFNSSTGLVCGNNGWIARTTNSGTNWDSISAPVNPNAALNRMQFINNSTGFICGNSIILKTTNTGINWSSILSTNYNFKSIYAVDVNNIYCSCEYHIFKSINGGVNWIIYNTNINNPLNIYFIDQNTGILTGEGSKFLVTNNGGINWVSKQYTGASLNYLYSLYMPYGISHLEGFENESFPPSGWRVVNILGNTIEWVRSTFWSYSLPGCALILNDCNISSGGGLDWLISRQIHIKSGDSLAFWLKPIYTGNIDSLCVRISTIDTSLSSFNTRILYLADGAGYPSISTWSRYSTSLNSFAGQNVYIGFKHQDFCGDGIFLDDVSVISSDLHTYKIFVAGDPNNIYITTNMGDNWSVMPILEPLQYTSFWNSLDVNGSTMITAGNNGILNVSTNDGANWNAFHSSVSIGNLNDVWFNYGTGKVWAVGVRSISDSSAHDQVLYSSNGGVTFQKQNVNGSKAEYKSISMLNENTGFICGNYGAIRKTTNGGTSWDSLINTIPPGNNLCKVDFVNTNSGWVFSSTTNASGCIWKTTNGGLFWTQQNLVDSLSIDRVVYTADMINENTGFCVNGNSAVHMTINGGVNWTALTPALYSGSIYEIYMVSTTEGYACGLGKLFKTTNQWTSYVSIPVPFPEKYSATKWININEGFVVCDMGFVLRTTNSGNEWECMTTSAPLLRNIYIKSIDTAYAVGTSGNIFKLERGPVGTITWKNSIPSQFYLGQNYPNPFNPITEFKFGLFSKGKVNLKVYDITGRLVQTYFDNMELNAGTVTVKFDGSNLASGVYFYTLFVDDNRIDTKKMILIK